MSTKNKVPTLKAKLKQMNKKIMELQDLREELIELAEDKRNEIENKADERESGDLTDREEERIDEIGDLIGTLEDEWDLDTIEW